MKLLNYILVFLFFATSVSAQYSDLGESTQEASDLIQEFFYSVPKTDIIIIQGSKLSMTDRIFFNLVKSQVDEIQSIEVISDRKSTDKNIVLLGSRRTNRYTGDINVTQKHELGPVILEFGTHSGKKVMRLYSLKETVNRGNNAIKKSPLNNFMDEKYVPAAATLLSLLFLYLWKILGNTIIETINEFISSKILDRESRKKKIKAHELVNRQEIFAFAMTVIIFSFTMSWTWEDGDFLRLFFLNIIIVGLISFTREIARIIMCHRYKLKSEYVFWPVGALVTIASTLLGNTFSTDSYTLLDEDEKDEKRFGKISLIISVFTFLLAISAYAINYLLPSLIMQMVFVYSIMILFIEMFPMNPFPGHDIKKWSFPVWMISYFFVLAAYIMMNFTTYV